MIEAAGLSKTYGKLLAVSGLNLHVKRGEIYGFLGANGAGKTTTMRMLMGMLVPSAGSARIAGLHCQTHRVEVKRLVGYLPDAPLFYDYLRGHELLSFVAEMHGLARPAARARAETLLGELGLAEAANDFAVHYSTGMRKRLGLACALVHDPQVLILDEPTNGLDPRAAATVQSLLQRWVKGGKTILLSTHLLGMAEQACSRIGILHRGRLIADGSLGELRARAGRQASLEALFLQLTDEPTPPGGPT